MGPNPRWRTSSVSPAFRQAVPLTTSASLNYELLGDLPIVDGMIPSHLLAQLWTPGYALAFTIPASLSIGYWRWRFFLNQLRRHDALGLDRRDCTDRRQAICPTVVEHRRGERRRPPRYLLRA
jgi:hypothetical protein